MNRLVLILLAFGFLSSAPGQAGAADANGVAKSFMVSAANPLAAEAGYDVLKSGGSAIDAMIATQLVLNLVEPQSSGIGGGAFLLHWSANSRALESFDGRETAPAAATPSRFLKSDGTRMGFWDAVVGGRSRCLTHVGARTQTSRQIAVASPFRAGDPSCGDWV